MSDNRLILDTARRTLAIEGEALAALEVSLNDTFAEVAKAIHACAGRIIVAGVGKSALVAQKTAATFNSTGTPAAFLHAGDAIHGDLGSVQDSDIVMMLSKSGETAEVRNLLPIIRPRCAVLVAVVARGDSFLAKQADFTLLTPLQREADVHNLAPTASAIAQMALGDALATAVMALRGFSRDDFAALHPGGSLGKRLTVTLVDLACRNARPQVQDNAPIADVVVALSSGRLGATAVIDAAGQLQGIITDGDLRRALGKGLEALRLSAKQLMTPNPVRMLDTQLAATGLAEAQARQINQLILVDQGGAYAGMVHLHDFIREGLA